MLSHPCLAETSACIRHDMLVKPKVHGRAGQPHMELYHKMTVLTTWLVLSLRLEMLYLYWATLERCPPDFLALGTASILPPGKDTFISDWLLIAGMELFRNGISPWYWARLRHSRTICNFLQGIGSRVSSNVHQVLPPWSARQQVTQDSYC